MCKTMEMINTHVDAPQEEEGEEESKPQSIEHNITHNIIVRCWEVGLI